jgi:hypothetical protein
MCLILNGIYLLVIMNVDDHLPLTLVIWLRHVTLSLDSWSVDHNTILMKKEQNERH